LDRPLSLRAASAPAGAQPRRSAHAGTRLYAGEDDLLGGLRRAGSEQPGMRSLYISTDARSGDGPPRSSPPPEQHAAIYGTVFRGDRGRNGSGRARPFTRNSSFDTLRPADSELEGSPGQPSWDLRGTAYKANQGRVFRWSPRSSPPLVITVLLPPLTSGQRAIPPSTCLSTLPRVPGLVRAVRPRRR